MTNDMVISLLFETKKGTPCPNGERCPRLGGWFTTWRLLAFCLFQLASHQYQSEQ